MSAEIPAILDAVDGSVHQETVERPDILQGSTVTHHISERLEPISPKNIFVHHDTHPVVYDVALLRKYGLEWFNWEHETLWKTILQDFHISSISYHAKSKIQAIRTLHINEWYWTKWEVFCWVTQALNNNIPDFQVLQKPSVPQILTSIDVATMVRDDEEFTIELQSFVAACFVDEGVLYAPKPIGFCQGEIETLLKSWSADFGLGTIKAVGDRWREVLSTPTAEIRLNETAVDIQVAKLVVARDYLALRRQQMKDQLRMLYHGS